MQTKCAHLQLCMSIRAAQPVEHGLKIIFNISLYKGEPITTNSVFSPTNDTFCHMSSRNKYCSCASIEPEVEGL